MKGKVDIRSQIRAEPPTSAQSRPRGRVRAKVAKGVAELGLVGFVGAVASAVWHTPGRRIRQIPITPALLLQGTAGP